MLPRCPALILGLVPFLKTTMDVSRQEHLHPLREPLVARMLVDAPVQLLHHALPPLDRRLRQSGYRVAASNASHSSRYDGSAASHAR
jgi:hypothetical protein